MSQLTSTNGSLPKYSRSTTSGPPVPASTRSGVCTVRVADDETMAAITVTQGGVEMLEIDDGTGNAPGTTDPMIGAVRALGGPAQGPQGERIGLKWSDAHFDLTECDLGAQRDRNTVFCARPGEGAVTYQFAVPGWDSEEIPPDALLRKVAYVKAIVWTPPA